MKPNLVILAAGLGSRYGGIKQIDSIGPNQEAIVDYSIFDAIEAGFKKIILVVREDISVHFVKFKSISNIEVVIANQEESKLINPERIKPWGTGHAVLSIDKFIDGPFSVINADDFYGRESYQKALDFFKRKTDVNTHALIGFPLNSTLSQNGTVSRAICEIDSNSTLTGIEELQDIWGEDDRIYYKKEGETTELNGNPIVSMNFWCFQENAKQAFRTGFERFLQNNKLELKSEYLIPHVAQSLLDNGSIIKVDTSSGTWFGITYKEDKPLAIQNIKELIKKGVYPPDLWG